MNTQKGFANLAILLIILFIAGVVLFILVNLKIIKNPLNNLPFFGKQVPKISTKTEYQNPFKKETQYVNPFETYKNPFVVSK